jgi:hypothetical protein
MDFGDLLVERKKGRMPAFDICPVLLINLYS